MTFRDEYESRPVTHRVYVLYGDGTVCEEWHCRSLAEAQQTLVAREGEYSRMHRKYQNKTFEIKEVGDGR